MSSDNSYIHDTREQPNISAKNDNQSYMRLMWKRFKRSWAGMMGLILILLLAVLTLFAEFFSPVDPKLTGTSFSAPNDIYLFNQSGEFIGLHTYTLGETDELDPVTFQPVVGIDYEQPISIGFWVKGFEYKLFGLFTTQRHFIGAKDGETSIHFLGTDKFGRDILSRIFYGARITLFIALTVVFLVTFLGTSIGMISGYLGGKTDGRIQRFVELILAFPQLPLYLALMSLIPITAPSGLFLGFVIAVMTALGWAQMSREVRGKTLSLAQMDYVKAAIAIGATNKRIIFQHIFPNVMSHVIVAVTLAIPSIILLESFLGFLGFAVKPPMISWGLMLQDTANYTVIGSYPWVLSPVAFVLITVFAFNALGDGLRDAVDPY